MTTATIAPPSAPEAPARGLLLPCLLCGEAEAEMLLSLADLDTCHCTSCDADLSLDDLAGRMARWHALLAWRDLAPTSTPTA